MSTVDIAQGLALKAQRRARYQRRYARHAPPPPGRSALKRAAMQARRYSLPVSQERPEHRSRYDAALNFLKGLFAPSLPPLPRVTKELIPLGAKLADGTFYNRDLWRGRSKYSNGRPRVQS